ncbi:MAG: hypothetical protein QG612_46 [Pseudomonadota bacterium]|nr:hypothetical protein [Pseudomonadota bacterium]
MQPTLTRAQPELDPDALIVWHQLNLLASAGERQAAVLALLMVSDNAREHRAWQEAVRGVHGAEAMRERIGRLPASARLPALERLLRAAAQDQPVEERQALLQSARRVMCADGSVSPLDRLLWLAMRHQLSGPVRLHRGSMREETGLEHLPLPMRLAIACLSGYLARMVPEPPRQERVDAVGVAWHDQVMRQVWGTATPAPTCQVPDVDQLGRALQTLSGLGWVHRPLLAKAWVDAADTRPGLRSRLEDPLPVAAEALRLACVLIDTPLPPALAAHFIHEPEQEPRAVGT